MFLFGGSPSNPNFEGLQIQPPSASNVALTLKGQTAQTANLLENRNSLNVLLSAFDKDGILVAATKTPASETDTGTTGMVAWDSTYIYVCTATNTWKRAPIYTWADTPIQGPTKNITSQIFAPDGLSAVSAFGVTQTANRAFAFLITLPTSTLVKTLNTYVWTPQASSHIVMAIYDNDATTFKPGSKVANTDSGQIATTGGGAKSYSINSGSGVTLSAGYYWLVFVTNNASMALQSYSYRHDTRLGAVASGEAARPATYLTRDIGSTTLPSPFGTPTVSTLTTGVGCIWIGT